MAIIDYYSEAKKRARREYRSCIGRGVDPYLPVLDKLVSGDRINSGSYAGLQHIPTAHIVGTLTQGRTSAFARNFMPLMGDGSEFADKWRHLCDAHLAEGIRDPIKAYEYMNRYYVVEGNKRVSVLKFFDAVEIPADVTRVLPERNGDPKVEMYYEQLEFSRYSQVNLMELSKPGSYEELQLLVGKAPRERWSDEDRSDFNTVYHYFEDAYMELGGKRLQTTTGDGLLTYIRIFGYDQVKKETSTEMREHIIEAWEEISLQQEEQPIDVILNPEAEKKPGFLNITLGQPKKKKVAFLYDRSPRTSRWCANHDLGRLHLEQVMEKQVATTVYANCMEQDPEKVLRQAIEDGNQVIFTTSPTLLPASLRVAVDHPEIMILNCSLNTSHRYIRTYYARMYEVKFIAGVIAGSLAGDEDIGYVCDYPIYGQIAGINAFALGVEMVNPSARVHLEWSSKDGLEKAVGRLKEKGITLISSQDVSQMTSMGTSSFGLSLINDSGSQVNLAAPVWRWDVYYETIMRRILDGSFRSEYQDSNKALNYYWGLSAGVVSIEYSPQIPDGVRKLCKVLEKSICSGICNPFAAPVYAQGEKGTGILREVKGIEQIVGMDWLVENVVGDIPAMEELSETGRHLVSIVGVDTIQGKNVAAGDEK